MTEEEKIQAAEAKLARLAERLKQGQVVLYPAREKDLEIVRETVRQEWEKEHQQDLTKTESQKQDKSQSQTEKTSQDKSQEQSQSQDSQSQDHDHDQSH